MSLVPASAAARRPRARPVVVLAPADELLEHRRSASLICRKSGSWPSRPSSSAIQARVPTLPTPTTLRAKSTSWNCSSRTRRSYWSVSAVVAQELLSAGLEHGRAPRTSAKSSSGTISGGSETIRALAVDLAGELRERLHAVAPARLRERLVEPLAHLARRTASDSCGISFSMSRRVYQTSRFLIPANSRHRGAVRGDRLEHDRAPARRGVKPLSRAAISMLTARRLTSHSHGPGSVSSKSLMSNTSRRSGEANSAEVRQVRVAAALHRQARSAASRPGRPP